MGSGRGSAKVTFGPPACHVLGGAVGRTQAGPAEEGPRAGGQGHRPSSVRSGMHTPASVAASGLS